MVAFESPRRLRKSLEAISERWPSRQLAVCRELTKIHEEAIRGNAAEVLERLGDVVRGEIVLVLESAGGQPAFRAAASSGAEAVPDSGLGLAPAVLETRAREALGQMLAQGMGTKVAAGIVAGLTGLPARRAYALALQARGDRGQQS